MDVDAPILAVAILGGLRETFLALSLEHALGFAPHGTWLETVPENFALLSAVFRGG